MEQPNLKALHSEGGLSRAKLDQMDRVPTADLLRSLFPGEKSRLKVRPDGTILDGHHRVYVLRGRGVDVDSLPRETIEREPDSE